MTSKKMALSDAIIYLCFGVFAYFYIPLKAISLFFLILGLLLLVIHKVFDYIDIRIADIILKLLPMAAIIILLLFI
jgi:hypothetical protein